MKLIKAPDHQEMTSGKSFTILTYRYRRDHYFHIIIIN